MCGRFTRMYTWQELVALYRLTLGTSNLQPRYNICPTTKIDTVVSRDGRRELVSMRWSLVPSWWSTQRDAARDLQRPIGDRRPKADVSLCIQTQPLHHSGVGLL